MADPGLLYTLTELIKVIARYISQIFLVQQTSHQNVHRPSTQIILSHSYETTCVTLVLTR